jgi:hypothetical protein
MRAETRRGDAPVVGIVVVNVVLRFGKTQLPLDASAH